MFSSSSSSETPFTARLGHNPRYQGSFHDAETARQLGYRGALVPGAFLYGYMSQLAVADWGQKWLRHGTIEARFRKPVYDGDKLVLHGAPLHDENGSLSVAMALLNAEGDEVAIGAVGLPKAPSPAPDVAGLPVFPLDGEVEPVAAGGLPEGFILRTRNQVVESEAHARSLDDFDEVYAPYRSDLIVHPGLLLRTAMGDANSSRRWPTPVILVAAAAEHFAIARVGDRLATSGRVTRSYERKGHHYFDSEEVLIANATTPIARFRRTSIYAARLTA